MAGAGVWLCRRRASSGRTLEPGGRRAGLHGSGLRLSGLTFRQPSAAPMAITLIAPASLAFWIEQVGLDQYLGVEEEAKP